MPTRCFMILGTASGHRALRRYAFGNEPCPRYATGHHALTPIDPALLTFRQNGTFDAASIDVADDDPRWPAACACGYTFTEDDAIQIAVYRIYQADDGRTFTIHPGRADRAPAGAMWRAEWLEPEMAGPDGMSLSVMLPGGYEWAIDGPSITGRHWKRSGTPPDLTVTPSIKSPNYHGYLTAGVLSDDTDGRSYQS